MRDEEKSARRAVWERRAWQEGHRLGPSEDPGQDFKESTAILFVCGGRVSSQILLLGAGTEQAKLGLFSILQEESNRGWTGQGVDGLFEEVTLRIIGFPGAE
jgi:hypothetical protein